MDCKEELRRTLIERMRHSDSHHGKITVEEFRARYKEREDDLAILALDLECPEEAIPLLRLSLKQDDPFGVIKAAATLALLGSKDGVDALRSVQTCTNSAIEYFYARAALILLGEPIPQRLRGETSVFRQLEEVVFRCQQELGL
jgi:hypothetical protein